VAARLWAERGVLGSPRGPRPGALRVQRGKGPAVPVRGRRGSPAASAHLEGAELGGQQLLRSAVPVRRVALEGGEQPVVTCHRSIQHSVHTAIRVQPVTRLRALPQERLSRAPVRVRAQHVILVSRETVFCGVRRRRPPTHCLCLPVPLAEKHVRDPPAFGAQHVHRHRRPAPVPSTSRGCSQAVPPDGGLGGHRRPPGLSVLAGRWLSPRGQVPPVRWLAGSLEAGVGGGSLLGAEGEGTVRGDGAGGEGAVG